MHTLYQLIIAHPVQSTIVLAAIYNAAVTTMPLPLPAGSRAYEWLFNFLHALTLNISRIRAQYNNGPPAAGK
jgi:hypothetical protein